MESTIDARNIAKMRQWCTVYMSSTPSPTSATTPTPTTAPLPREFYLRDTAVVARDLLGSMLVRHYGGQSIMGMIYETEAYGHRDDPASHAYRGVTKRNKVMFGRVGISYVYFTYGMHFCFNVTARNPEYADAGAVLIRGLIPIRGMDIIMKNRGTTDTRILTDGPAKLTQALNIKREQYGVDLTGRGGLYIASGDGCHDVSSYAVVRSPRVGIRKATDRLWNFKLQSPGTRRQATA